MAIPQLPPPVEITLDMKRVIIDRLKRALEIYQQAGAVDSSHSYAEIVHEPALLYQFIAAFRAQPELVAELTQDAEGRPVSDPDQTLECGLTLAQVQQLLVKTCAKFYFDRMAEGLVTETVTTKSMLFFKKTEQIERVAIDPLEERKGREIMKSLAFDWQLPLLEPLRGLSSQHLMEIGEDLVAIAAPEQVKVLAGYDPSVIKKARISAGPDFPEILHERPTAIPGIAVWSHEMYEFYRKMLGEKAWLFFSREQSFFNVVASLDKSVAKCYGDVLCSIAGANLEEIQRLNIDKTEILVEALRYALGTKVHAVLSIPAFSRDVLRKLVESLLHMKGEKDQLRGTFQVTCKAIVPSIMEWLATQK